jgi:hypothetical protein
MPERECLRHLYNSCLAKPVFLLAYLQFMQGSHAMISGLA